jgi:arsenite methyltransferase
MQPLGRDIGTIEVRTADMRELPFPNESFDIVLSHWAVHNIHKPEERAEALSEMVRVLKPAGCVVLADIEHQDEYAAGFAHLGLEDIKRISPSWRTKFMSMCFIGKFCPTAVFARKPPL